MVFCIGFGYVNKNYLYILSAVACKLISQLFLGLGYSVLKPIILYKSKLKDSPITYFTSSSFFSLIIGFICRKISRKIQDEEKNINNKPINRATTRTTLIVYEKKEKNTFEKLITLFIIGLFFVFCEIFDLMFYLNNLEGLDYWMFEIIILNFFMKKYLKTKIFKHQKLSLYICVTSSFIIKIVSNQLNSKENDEKGKMNVYSFIIEKFGHWIFIQIFIFLFLLMNILRSFGNTKAKYLMDILFIPHYSILIIYGFFGIIFCLLYIFICFIFDVKIGIIGTINNCFEDENYLITILFTLLFGIFNSLKILFDLLIIMKLSPFFMFAKYKTYYIIIQAILLLYGGIDDGFKTFYCVEVTSDIICFIGFLIYFEIIEIRCKEFNNDIIPKIDERAKDEEKNLNKEEILNPEEIEEEEENEDINNKEENKEDYTNENNNFLKNEEEEEKLQI